MRVTIVDKNQECCKETCLALDKMIQKSGFTYDETNPEVVFFVGGDGTLLRAVNKYIDKLDLIIFVGINKGELGFLCEFSIDDIDIIFNSLKNNALESNSYSLICGEFEGNKVYALNEIRLENPYYTLVCNAYINGKFFEKFHGTGLLVCSTLGSSAYNRSLNGALVDHSLEILQLSEIAPIQNNAYRSLGSSLVLKKDSIIRLSGTFKEAIVGYDHLFTPIHDSKELVISLSDKRVKIAKKDGLSFLDKVSRSFIK